MSDRPGPGSSGVRLPAVWLPAVRLRAVRTPDLTAAELAAIRAMLAGAFGDDEESRFDDHDWQHALGGLHILAALDGEIVAHASVVPRELHVAGRPLHTGYVEAVGVAPARQRRGLGSLVMRAAGEHILERYQLGTLGTGEQGFYERLGWRTWRGPTFVRPREGVAGDDLPDVRTPDEDGGIMVLLTPATRDLDLDAPISCEWRPGDVW